MAATAPACGRSPTAPCSSSPQPCLRDISRMLRRRSGRPAGAGTRDQRPREPGHDKAQLARRYETVVAEDLYVTGMLANKRLARAVADQGFGTARRMLAYKTAWHGRQLGTVAGRYPPPKTCTARLKRKPNPTLSARTVRC